MKKSSPIPFFYSRLFIPVFLFLFLFSFFTGCTVVGSSIGGGGVVGGGAAPTVSIPAPVVTRITVSSSEAGTLTIRGGPGATVGRYFITGKNRTREGSGFLEKLFWNTAYAATTVKVLSATDGSFIMTLDGNRGDVIAIDQTDILGNVSVAVIVPTSLKIFLTASTFNGNLSGVTGADNLCMNDANRPDSNTYKALIVDGVTRVACTSGNCMGGGVSENVDWVLEPTATYVRADATTVIGTTTASAIFTFDLTNSFTGTAVTYWTGLDDTWISSGNTCNAWTSSAVVGELGFGSAVNSTSIDLASAACITTVRLLCVEQ